MRVTALLLILLGLTLVSCKHYLNDYEIDRGRSRLGWSPPEENGNHVDIAGGWRLTSEALNVTRDASREKVLRVGAQAGATLTSLQAPRHTQVATTARAEAIYYDAFHNRFELVGDPVIEQGAKVTRRFGHDAKLVMFVDGNILVRDTSSLVEPTT